MKNVYQELEESSISKNDQFLNQKETRVLMLLSATYSARCSNVNLRRCLIGHVMTCLNYVLIHNRILPNQNDLRLS